jgi:enediyne biosynthesis protein E3
MESTGIIAEKMENIKRIFQNARETAAKHKDLHELVKLLENTDREFLSVAFEGASMEIALTDFAEDPSMKSWLSYLDLCKHHAAQIFIGLGWAVAQEKKTDLNFVNTLEPGMLFRMWDGCGYFDGILRQRQVVKNLSRLDYIPEKDVRAYDQGLGRSIWYSTKGNPSRSSEFISGFPPARQPDLWRGIGIATSYVGGFNKEMLYDLLSLSGHHKVQLGIGAAMVAKSRIQANCMTPDIETACAVFCNMTANEAMEITVEADLVAESFDSWLSLMENKAVVGNR